MRAGILGRIGTALACMVCAGIGSAAVSRLAHGTPPEGPADEHAAENAAHDLWRFFWDNLGFLPPPLTNDSGGSHSIDTGIRISCGHLDHPTYGTVVVVGHTYAEVDPSNGDPNNRLPLADAWFASGAGECGLNHGPIGPGFLCRSGGCDHLVVMLNAGIHVDKSTTDGIRSKHQLSVHRYGTTDCSGTVLETKNDTAGYCEPTTQAVALVSMHTTTDSAETCHAPRVTMDWPSTSGTYSYKTEISVRICDIGGANCNDVSSDTGCFSVTYL